MSYLVEGLHINLHQIYLQKSNLRMQRFTPIKWIKFNKNSQPDKKYILRSDKMSKRIEWISEIDYEPILIDDSDYVGLGPEDFVILGSDWNE